MERVGRRGFWICAAILAVGFTLLWSFTSYDGVGGLAAVTFFLFRPRLHDIGRSGWWALVPLGIAFLLGFLAIAEQLPPALTPTPELIFAIIFVLSCVAIGFVPGQPGRNRYGDPRPSYF